MFTSIDTSIDNAFDNKYWYVLSVQTKTPLLFYLPKSTSTN